MVQIIFVFACLISTSLGFLLDAQTGNGGSASGQFITASTFFEEKKLQQQDLLRQRQETDRLRHDTEQNFALLTSQLNEKLHEMEQKLMNSEKLNKTQVEVNNLQRKISELEQKYTVLEQKYQVLEFKNNELERRQLSIMSNLSHELSLLVNKTDNLELKGENNEQFKNMTNSQFFNITSELLAMKRETTDIHREMAVLLKLPNIKPLHQIEDLQQTVNTIKSKFDRLTLKENARDQDFIALVQMTLKTESSLQDLKEQMLNLDQNQTDAYSLLNQNVEKQVLALKAVLSESETRTNATISALRNRNTPDRVAMTAYPPNDHGYHPGNVIQFTNVGFSVGINNLRDYRYTGKFTCEKAGLYLITVTMQTDLDNSEFYIYINGNMASRNYKQLQSNAWQTSTAVVVFNLNVHDRVWVQSGLNPYNVRGSYNSRFAIVKIN